MVVAFVSRDQSFKHVQNTGNEGEQIDAAQHLCISEFQAIKLQSRIVRIAFTSVFVPF